MADDKEREIQLQFLDEAEDHLQDLESVFMGLSSSRVDSTALNGALRAAHSMKGGGSLMGFPVLSQLSHRLEDGMKVLKIQKDSVDIDDRLEYLLLSAVDCLRSIIDENRKQITPSPDWLTYTANPIFDELYERLGDPTEEDAESVLSPEDGADILPVLFETEVEGCLQRIEDLLATPDKPCLYEEILILAQELGGLGAMLQLDAFCHLCASIAYALQADPTRTLDIAHVAVAEWRRSQSLVLTQQLDLLPRTIEVSGLDIRLAPNLDPTDFLAMVPVSHDVMEEDHWPEEDNPYAHAGWTQEVIPFTDGEFGDREFSDGEAVSSDDDSPIANWIEDEVTDSDLGDGASGQGLPDDVFSTAHGISFHIRSREDSDQTSFDAGSTASEDIFEMLPENSAEQIDGPFQKNFSPQLGLNADEHELLSELFPTQETRSEDGDEVSERLKASDAEGLDSKLADDTLGALDAVVIQDWGDLEEGDPSTLQSPAPLSSSDDTDTPLSPSPLDGLDDSDGVFTELDALLAEEPSSSDPFMDAPTEPSIVVDTLASDEVGMNHLSELDHGDGEEMKAARPDPLAPLNEVDIWDVDDAQQPFYETFIEESSVEDFSPLEHIEDSEALKLLEEDSALPEDTDDLEPLKLSEEESDLPENTADLESLELLEENSDLPEEDTDDLEPLKLSEKESAIPKDTDDLESLELLEENSALPEEETDLEPLKLSKEESDLSEDTDDLESLGLLEENSALPEEEIDLESLKDLALSEEEEEPLKLSEEESALSEDTDDEEPLEILEEDSALLENTNDDEPFELLEEDSVLPEDIADLESLELLRENSALPEEETDLEPLDLFEEGSALPEDIADSELLELLEEDSILSEGSDDSELLELLEEDSILSEGSDDSESLELFEEEPVSPEHAAEEESIELCEKDPALTESSDGSEFIVEDSISLEDTNDLQALDLFEEDSGLIESSDDLESIVEDSRLQEDPDDLEALEFSQEASISLESANTLESLNSLEEGSVLLELSDNLEVLDLSDNTITQQHSPDLDTVYPHPHAPSHSSTVTVLEGLDALDPELVPGQDGVMDEAPLESITVHGNPQDEWTLDGVLDDFADLDQGTQGDSPSTNQNELSELDDWLAEVEEWMEEPSQHYTSELDDSASAGMTSDGMTSNETNSGNSSSDIDSSHANTSDEIEELEIFENAEEEIEEERSPLTDNFDSATPVFDAPLQTAIEPTQDVSGDISQDVPTDDFITQEETSPRPDYQTQSDNAAPRWDVDPVTLTPEPEQPYSPRQASDLDSITAVPTIEADSIAIQQSNAIQTDVIQADAPQTSIQADTAAFTVNHQISAEPGAEITAIEKASNQEGAEVTEFQLLNPTSSGVLPTHENENTFVRVGSKHLNQLNDLFGELTIDRNGLTLHLKRLRSLVKTLNRRVKLLDQANTQLRSLYDQGATVTADGTVQEGGPYTRTPSFTNIEGTAWEDSDLDSVALGLDDPFDALEMDNYSDLHHLFQAVMEGMVQIQEVAEDLDLNLDDSEQSARSLNKTARQLQIELMHVRMRPLSDIANRFPRALRELSLKHKKPVEFKLHGGNTLIDRTILDSLGEPLMHLVRNAFDHGIEDPVTRKACGKSEVATVEIRASHQGNRTIISISDDGQGIALDKIRDRARQMGLDEMLLAAASEQELLSLIFEPGFSTAAKTTDLSGRGVGMDVVRDRLQHIHGDIKISTRAGQGTTFTLSVPLTLSVTRVLLAESNGMLIAIPTDTVDEMIMLEPEQIMTTVGREVFEYDGKMAELIRLDQWLHFYCPRAIPDPLETPASIKVPSVLIVKRGHQITGIEVERSWSEQEVTIRRVVGVPPMPDGFSSCTILGDGRVVPLVNIPALMHWVMSNQRTTPTIPHLSSQPSPEGTANPTLFSSTIQPNPAPTADQFPVIEDTDSLPAIAPSESLDLSDSGVSIADASAFDTSTSVPPISSESIAYAEASASLASPPPPRPPRQRPHPTVPDPSTYYLLNQKPQILIVDDSIAVRRLLALTLEKASYRVEQAKDGQDALEKLNTGLQVDAMICDIEMPRLDGYRLLAKMKASARLKHVPVMMLTSRSGDKHRKLAMSLGAIAYFTKPYNEQLLVQRLADIAQVPV